MTTPSAPPAATPAAAAKPATPEVDNDFSIILSQHDRGASLTELSSTLRDLVIAVRTTGKKGKIKYTLEVLPVKNTEGKRVELCDDIVVSLPKPSRRPSNFFTTEDGRLVRKDPDQVDWIDEQEKIQRELAEKAERERQQGKLTMEQLKAAAK